MYFLRTHWKNQCWVLCTFGKSQKFIPSKKNQYVLIAKISPRIAHTQKKSPVRKNFVPCTRWSKQPRDFTYDSFTYDLVKTSFSESQVKAKAHKAHKALLSARVLPYKRLMGMCSWMGSHFHDWIDYHRVAFSIEFTRMGLHIFWGKTVLHISS